MYVSLKMIPFISLVFVARTKNKEAKAAPKLWPVTHKRQGLFHNRISNSLEGRKKEKDKKERR